MTSMWIWGEHWISFILTLNKAFDAVCHNIITDKHMKYGIDKRTVKKTAELPQKLANSLSISAAPGPSLACL